MCTRNRAQQLERCLQALTRLRYPNYQILVVENGTPDGHTRQIAERYQARYLNSPIVGLSRARNEGAKNCDTELIAFTDDDAIPCENWLANLACEFREPTVMAVAGEVLPLVVDKDGFNRVHVSTPPGSCMPHQVVNHHTTNWFTLTNFGGIGNGGNMCFRRAAFEHWRGFDERLGRGALLNSAEEHFSFFQLVLLGFQCVHTPDAIVYHPTLESLDDIRRNHCENLANAIAYAGLLWVEFLRLVACY